MDEIIKYKAILVALMVVITSYAIYIDDISLWRMSLLWCSGYTVGDMR